MRTTCAATGRSRAWPDAPEPRAGRRAPRGAARFEEDAFADRAFRGEAAGLDQRERSLAMRLAYGTIQRKGTLAWITGQLAKGRLEPGVRAALWLGLYQLLYSGHPRPRGDRRVRRARQAQPGTPRRQRGAAARAAPGGRAAGRRHARRRRDPPLASASGSSGCGGTGSAPTARARCWWPTTSPPEHAVRVNTLVGGRLPRRARPRAARGADPRGPARRLRHARVGRGRRSWRNRAARCTSARAVDPQPGERVLDLCAAPGGKTTHLAALMGGEGEVVAIERHEGRAASLRETCARMKAASSTSGWGTRRTRRSRGRSIACSSIRRAPGWERCDRTPICAGAWCPSAVERLAAEQDAILAAARRHLTPGGRLVYSVCTLSPGGGAARRKLQRRLWPHEDDSDGFYIAVDG